MSYETGWKHFPFNEIKLKVKEFPSSLKGLRIVQLSDLHLKKKIDLLYIKTLVAKINELNPDLVFFTGDILETRANNLKEHINIFKDIEAKTYYVSGNHDIYYGAKQLSILMNEANIICLDNAISTLHVKGEILQLIGFSDRYSFLRGIKRDIKELFKKADQSLPTILLAHQPKDIQYIKDNRVDIQFSGHTHGGQVYPISKIVKLFQPYFSGLYTHNKTLLYVTNGIGYWGVEFRYKANSEIPVFIID